MDFERVLRTLAEFFKENGAEWGVIGGLAMAAHGAARTTLDVDVVVNSYFVRYGLEDLFGRLDEN